MKRVQILLIGLIVSGIAFGGLSACEGNADSSSPEIGLLRVSSEGYSDFLVGNLTLLVDSTITATEEELDGLRYMKEEEKLARDVYSYLYEKWGSPVFSNIGRSESRHLGAVIYLLSVYSPADTIVSAPGLFTDTRLQELYNSLTEKGDVSIEEAYMVGATIEDMDILDLENYIASTVNTNIIMVYENLQRGSRNHLRAFNSRLISLGVSYEPQYIDGVTFNDIINSPVEQGRQYHGGRNW